MKEILIFLIFCSSLAAQNKFCPSKSEYKNVSKKEFQDRSDSIRRSLDEFWEYKVRMEKEYGLMVDNFEVQSIRFEQFCSTSNDLNYLYSVIDYMTKNKEMKVRLQGSLDSFEFKTNAELSLNRIEFVREVMLFYKISESRIEVFDALANRPRALPKENGNPENRRVEIFVIE